MASSNGSDIVLPIIQQQKGKMVTAGVVRKKSTPKIISTRRHFELYDKGDVRTQVNALNTVYCNAVRFQDKTNCSLIEILTISRQTNNKQYKNIFEINIGVYGTY